MLHFLSLYTGFPQLLLKKSEKISIAIGDKRLLAGSDKVC